MDTTSRTRSSVPVQRRPALHRGRITLNPPGLFPLKLACLMDHEVKEVSAFALPIEENHLAGMRRDAMCRDEEFVLPRTLVALEDLFGVDSHRYEEWKCSLPKQARDQRMCPAHIDNPMGRGPGTRINPDPGRAEQARAAAAPRHRGALAAQSYRR